MSVEQGEWNPFLYSQMLSESLSHRPPSPKGVLEEDAWGGFYRKAGRAVSCW